jgi:hypothetical protein
MAFRLNDLVVCGELINTKSKTVHGWLGLRGFERPMTFELTGNCDADLAGRHIRFKLRNPPEDEPDIARTMEEEKAKLEKLNLTGFAWQQIGATGTMTADHKVRHADCSVKEMYLRAKLGEPVPTEWKRCLYIEWYSQNGRVVLEMVDPIIEFVEPDGRTEISSNEETVRALQEKEEASPETQPGLSITSIELGEDGEYEIRDATPFEEDEMGDGESESYGVVPDELQKQLDAQTRETERALRSEEENEVIREMEIMDEAIEQGKRQPLGALFDDVVKTPRPDGLTEEEAEVHLKVLLGHLAMLGIALHVCEHFSWRDAYRLMVERLCREEVAFEQLRGTQWVQHFMTSEYCRACEAEMEKEFEQQKRSGEDDSAGDDSGRE